MGFAPRLGKSSPHRSFTRHPSEGWGPTRPPHEWIIAGTTLPLLGLSEQRRNGSRPEPVLGPAGGRTRGPGRRLVNLSNFYLDLDSYPAVPLNPIYTIPTRGSRER